MNPFEKYLEENNIKDITLIKSKESTHTAQQAADTHNVPVSNIVKSLIVNINKEFFVYLAPGDKKLDLNKLGGRMATAEEVKEITGYSIGGVPPFGHKTKLKTYIMDGFKDTEPLLAAGGKPDLVFKITLERLKELAISKKFLIAS